ncbi:hypothetical protein [Nocardia sp. NPDC004860]|uniref:hypothetical protein n=1 Tax=Nocardia sp. NPDC004860 TaxID=3154557 RepID=UPI0033B8F145
MSVALEDHLDLTKMTPELLRYLTERSATPYLRTLLRQDNKGELAKWLWGRQPVDIAAEHPRLADPQGWADMLKRIQPRLYSTPMPTSRSSPRTSATSATSTELADLVRSSHPRHPRIALAVYQGRWNLIRG